MQKQAPSIGRIVVMAAFSLSVFGILLWLWLSFGGAVPLKPQEYRVKVPFPEAATLAFEADVRISGINVGKVKELEFQKSPPRTIATLGIDSEYAPLPADARAMLRQKTLLGETYVELTPGSAQAPDLAEGESLPTAQVVPSVELDEIFQALDRPTREAFQEWMGQLARSIDGGRGLELNAAFGNLAGFAESGTDLLAVLDRRQEALGRFVRNTGFVFEAVSRSGELDDLIRSSHRLFSVTSARDDALAEIFETFPTFLAESRVTLARLERFSRDTRPLVNELKPVARDLGLTVRDLAGLSPDLVDLFDDLEALIDVAPDTLPEAARFLRAAEPVMGALHAFLPQLNPILSYAYFSAPDLADFFTVGGAALAAGLPQREGDPAPRHLLRQIGIINSRSLALNEDRPEYERANAYLAPNAWLRWRPLGVLESFDCAPAGGRKPDPEDGLPPCFVEPPSLWDGNTFPRLSRGEAPIEPPPDGNEGTQPPPQPGPAG